MTEASVSGVFMKNLRLELQGSVVVKHRDASFIGLPDCSITHQGHVAWCEFKLYPWQNWMEGASDLELASRLLERATKGSPAQRDMMDRFAQTTLAFYLVWVKKSFVLMIDPLTLSTRRYNRTTDAVHAVKDMMLSWAPSPAPSI